MSDVERKIKTVGILGSGQLGRMLALEARRMGIKTIVYSPGSDTPAGRVTDGEMVGDYDDLAQVRAFAEAVDVITYEFENVPLASALAAQEIVPVYPQPLALEVSQNRIREKNFLREHGCPVAPFYAVQTVDDLKAGVAQLGIPCVLKTAESGYDGKGQFKITAVEQIELAWEKIGRQPAVLEAWVTFAKEISVIVARDRFDQFAYYGPIENHHENHILDVSVCPAEISDETMINALAVARQVIRSLDVVGLICVEFFVLDGGVDGKVLVNEIAPRPHNSGHLTIEGHVTSQFEQQLRTVCGWAVGDTTQMRPAVAMANLLGDVWPEGGEPDWPDMLHQECDVKLHLYGKEAARPGRKMGHLTASGQTAAEVRETVLRARKRLK